MLMDFVVAEAQQENNEMKEIITQIHLQDSWRNCGSSENRCNRNTLDILVATKWNRKAGKEDNTGHTQFFV